MFQSNEQVDPKIAWRREVVFIVLAGIFLGSLAMLNILGLSKLIDLSFTIGNIHVPFRVFIGVLPYPITFLCTDFIGELYGRKRANTVVWVGLLLNFWVLFIMWVGGVLPPQPVIDPATGLPPYGHTTRAFYEIQMLTKAATAGSMIAYLTAQFVDVQVFHFLKKITKGKHLWLRNNGSTFTSQMVDSIAVIFITYYYTHAIKVPEGETVASTLTVLILSGYVFKMTSALIDTVPFYIGTKYLARYLQINPVAEFEEEKYGVKGSV
jgi:queuosine precursor transporter